MWHASRYVAARTARPRMWTRPVRYLKPISLILVMTLLGKKSSSSSERKFVMTHGLSMTRNLLLRYKMTFGVFGSMVQSTHVRRHRRNDRTYSCRTPCARRPHGVHRKAAALEARKGREHFC